MNLSWYTHIHIEIELAAKFNMFHWCADCIFNRQILWQLLQGNKYLVKYLTRLAYLSLFLLLSKIETI